ncbi:MAG: polysaccharide deacetylase family protein [Alphaproteobacteria bacterium]|nr:polysaccharide deacetylase family protein [Alphaproteobacteria bacterium]
MSNPRVPFQMATERAALQAPDGKPLIVHLVVAVEYWRFEDPMPRVLLTPPHGQSQVPDVPNYSWAEYGMRCGMPRLLKVLGDRGLRADACVNAGVIDAYPQVAEAMLAAGWEFQGHGMHQKAMAEADEAAFIQACVHKLESFTGTRPRGWIGPGLKESFETPDYLKAAGIDYLCDWVIDDVPTWMRTENGPLVVVPYTLELNDSVIYAVEKHASPEQYERLTYCLEALEPELVTGPRVLTLSFHHHLSGVLHRIGFVAKMLDLLQSRQDTVFMTGAEIADWFSAQSPAEAH